MPRVASALSANYHVRTSGKYVDSLTFAFVAPLSAD